MAGRPAQGSRDQLARTLPTIRVRLEEQVQIMLVVCRHKDEFTSKQIADNVGMKHERAGLVMGFLVACGLVVKLSGRGIYKVPSTGRAIASAWDDDETQGRYLLGKVLVRQWFGKAVRQKLADGPGLRGGLVQRLMLTARASEPRRGEVELLVDWLMEARLVFPDTEGFVRWHDTAPTTDTPADAEERPMDEPTQESQDHVEEELGQDAPSAAHVPPPRTSDDTPPAAGVEDLADVLRQPLSLSELTRLSVDELVAMHGHIRGLVTAVAVMKGQAMKT